MFPSLSPRRALFLAVATTFIAAPSTGVQLRGRIIDLSAAPLSGALVEIWSPTTRLAAQVSDEGGAFYFTEDLARSAVLITVRRIGYQPARIPVTRHSDLTVTLAPFPQTLPPVAATAPRLCPNQPFRPDLGVWSPTRVIFARVGPRELGAIDTTQTVDGQVAAGGDYFDMLTRRVRRTGYAWPYQGLRQQRFDDWEYPRLESFFAGHFMDSGFGELHRFSFGSRTPLVLVFCPRDATRPSIQGRLDLEADTSLGKATWIFQTPEPREDAGGEVIFARPGSEAARPVLLPLIGLFWRKIIVDYYQEWMQFEGWRSCGDDPDPRFCR